MSEPSPATRSGRSATRQVAALPWRVTDGALEVLLVTSRETRRWVIPKGGRMAGKTDPEAAAIEAFEEAGVEGDIADRSIGTFRYLKRLRGGDDRLCVVNVFPLQVAAELQIWPEVAERERSWMSPAQAAQCVHEPELARLITAFNPVD